LSTQEGFYVHIRRKGVKREERWGRRVAKKRRLGEKRAYKRKIITGKNAAK